MHHEPLERWIRQPLTSFGALWFLDWLTTAMVFSLGGGEAHPVWEGSGLTTMLAAKAGYFCVLTSVYLWTRKLFPRMWDWMFVGLTVLMSTVNLWNLGRIGILVETLYGSGG